MAYSSSLSVFLAECTVCRVCEIFPLGMSIGCQCPKELVKDFETEKYPVTSTEFIFSGASQQARYSRPWLSIYHN